MHIAFTILLCILVHCIMYITYYTIYIIYIVQCTGRMKVRTVRHAPICAVITMYITQLLYDHDALIPCDIFSVYIYIFMAVLT